MKATLAAILLMLATVQPALACSCRPPPPPDEQRERASAAFVGRVVALVEKGEVRTYEFAVSENFKGASGAKIFVSSSREGGLCGSFFDAGAPYLIFANGPSDRLNTYVCNANREATSAEGRAVIEALRRTGKR